MQEVAGAAAVRIGWGHLWKGRVRLVEDAFCESLGRRALANSMIGSRASTPRKLRSGRHGRHGARLCAWRCLGCPAPRGLYRKHLPEVRRWRSQENIARRKRICTIVGATSALVDAAQQSFAVPGRLSLRRSFSSDPNEADSGHVVGRPHLRPSLVDITRFLYRDGPHHVPNRFRPPTVLALRAHNQPREAGLHRRDGPCRPGHNPACGQFSKA